MQQAVQLHHLRFVPYIKAADIQSRVQEIAAALSKRYEGQTPVFISILSGAFIYAADLMRAYEGPCETAFVKLSSYSGTQSGGTIKTEIGLEKHVEGRHLIVVEDIIDTGRTLHFFLKQLAEQKPASILVTAFLRKPDAAEYAVPAELVGYDIENRFVVGYGLDYDGLGRNLPDIYILEDAPE